MGREAEENIFDQFVQIDGGTVPRIERGIMMKKLLLKATRGEKLWRVMVAHILKGHTAHKES